MQSQIDIRVDLLCGKRKGFSIFEQGHQNKYYSDMRLFGLEIRSYIEVPEINIHFNTSTFLDAMLTIPKCDILRNTYASFCFFVFRIMVAQGLLEDFIVSITFCRSQELFANAELKSILEKYNLNDFTQASREKALRCAAVNNQPEDIEFLVNVIKVNIDAQDNTPGNQKTALHLATERGHKESVDELVKLNASSSICDAGGVTVDDLNRKVVESPVMRKAH